MGEPNPRTYTYNQCQIRFHPEVNSGRVYLLRGYSYRWGYTWRYGFGNTGPESGPKSYFQFRIESPPTREYWNTVFEHCNSKVKTLEQTYKLKTSITTQASETYTKSKTLKLGLETASYLIASIGYEATETYSTTNMKQISEGEEKTIHMSVPPGKKIIIKQFVGKAGYVTIKTKKFITT